MTTHLTSALAFVAVIGLNAEVRAQPISTDIGLIGDESTPVFASASVIDPQFPFNLAVFDWRGEVVGQARSIATGVFTLPLQLSKGTYYLASWGGFGLPSSPWQIPTIGVGSGNDASIVGNVHAQQLGDLGSPAGFFRFYVGEPNIFPSSRVVTTRADFDIETDNASFRTALGLYDDTGILLRSDDADQGSTRIIFRDRPEGRYFVSLSGEQTTFSSRFLADPSSNSESGSAFLDLGGLGVLNLLVRTNEVVWTDFRVRDEGPDILIPGDVPEIQTVRIEMRDNGSLFPNVALFGQGGNLIARDLDLDLARIETTLQAGEYIIAANNWRTEYADGFVTLAEDFKDSNETGPYELSVGTATITGQEIESADDTDFYRFTVEATVDLGEIAEGPQAFALATSSTDPDLDTEIALYSLDGLVLRENDDGGAGGLSRLDFPDGFLRGNYYVAVAGSDTGFFDGFQTDVDGDEDTGDYALEYSGLSRQTDLGFGGDVDFYTFEIGVPSDLGVIGTAGEVVSIDTFASQFDTVIAVWDETGTLVEVNDDDISTGESRIQRVYAPGVYHFGVTGTGATFDDGFRIDVDPAGPLGDYAGVAGDLSYSGRTADRDRFDLFRFEIIGGCNAADVVEPFGLLDLGDTDAFIGAFLAGDVLADLVAPMGVFDLSDIDSFIAAFQAGCP
ncbi:MAG: GC-type dockerin domain-anchored protein [Planctomycetota bacterium]